MFSELLFESSKMVEKSKNFKVLELENAKLRDKLKKLTVKSEKSVAVILESSNHETVRLEKLLALRDKQLDDLRKDLDSQRDLVQATESEMNSLREEHAQWDYSVLAPMNISDSATSEPRLDRIKLVEDILFDFRQTLEKAGELVKLSDLHTISVQEVRDKAKEIPKLIEDWKISYARTAAQTALTMVMSHHSEMEIWHVTKSIAEEDNEGNPQDIKAIQDSCAGYSCRVAKMTNYTTPFFRSVAVPPSPQEPEDSLAKASSESEFQGDNVVGSSAPSSSPPPPESAA